MMAAMVGADEGARERARARAREAPAPGVAAVAGLLADATRACFCLALMDGRAWTAKELAHHAGVAASTASEHLNLLVGGGLLAEVRQGRHRYLRLAGSEAAELVEHLAAFAPPGRAPAPAARSLPADGRRRALGRARTCYDHLAGELGVAIADAMTGRGLLRWEGGLTLTPGGETWLAELGIAAPPPPRASRRPLVRPCLDWTERRHHLGGWVGAALYRHAVDAAWVTRIGTTRAVALTPEGRHALRDRLGLRASPPATPPPGP
jgi:DNA-binding transcriptional ArsR family regulator